MALKVIQSNATGKAIFQLSEWVIHNDAVVTPAANAAMAFRNFFISFLLVYS